ncbi:hypothetical protein FRC06_005353 [Ceratobasidium sp. 370]|nr:hypothetical protein FRC06_005353 [Ceratobasidium sp. 370]
MKTLIVALGFVYSLIGLSQGAAIAENATTYNTIYKWKSEAPTSSWECQDKYLGVTKFASRTIEKAIDRAIERWDANDQSNSRGERWGNDKLYPHFVRKNIFGWPHRLDPDNKLLCDKWNGVGSYPIINNRPESVSGVNPDLFRVLISKYPKVTTDNGRETHTFAFCGLAAHWPGYSKDYTYRMCKPTWFLEEPLEQDVLA